MVSYLPAEGVRAKSPGQVHPKAGDVPRSSLCSDPPIELIRQLRLSHGIPLGEFIQFYAFGLTAANQLTLPQPSGRRVQHIAEELVQRVVLVAEHQHWAEVLAVLVRVRPNNSQGKDHTHAYETLQRKEGMMSIVTSRWDSVMRGPRRS